jgi:hypothetical protein
VHDVKIVFNVLCNKEIRILRLESLVEQLTFMNTGFISIRLRGEFAEDAKQQLEDVFHKKNFERFRIRIGDTYKQWKMNTLEQVIFDGPEMEYIGIFQEDFRFTSSAEIVECYVRDAIRLREEAIELLPGPYYGMLPPLDASQIWKNRKKYVVSLHLDRLNILKMGRIVHALTNWPAIYKKELLIKALVSRRPLFKKFHPDFPFDWEKSIRAKWLLPFRWCAPRFEILACIDYDSLWPGSSLQSRQLLDDKAIREDDTLDLMARNTISFAKEIEKRVLKKLQATEPSSDLSFLTLLKHKMKRLLIYVNGIRYSLISMIIVPFRLDEMKLRKFARSLIK